jgi:hypothetical protein
VTGSLPVSPRGGPTVGVLVSDVPDDPGHREAQSAQEATEPVRPRRRLPTPVSVASHNHMAPLPLSRLRVLKARLPRLANGRHLRHPRSPSRQPVRHSSLAIDRAGFCWLLRTDVLQAVIFTFEDVAGPRPQSRLPGDRVRMGCPRSRCAHAVDSTNVEFVRLSVGGHHHGGRQPSRRAGAAPSLRGHGDPCRAGVTQVARDVRRLPIRPCCHEGELHANQLRLGATYLSAAAPRCVRLNRSKRSLCR